MLPQLPLVAIVVMVPLAIPSDSWAVVKMLQQKLHFDTHQLLPEVLVTSDLSVQFGEPPHGVGGKTDAGRQAWRVVVVRGSRLSLAPVTQAIHTPQHHVHFFIESIQFA